jgi:hypothetical protein
MHELEKVIIWKTVQVIPLITDEIQTLRSILENMTLAMAGGGYCR